MTKKRPSFGEILPQFRREGQFYVPFQLKRIMVENIGPIKKADLSLKETNLILGGGGSGKSILLNLIYNIGNRHYLGNKKIITHNKKNGKIKLELVKSISCLEYKFNIDSQNNEKYSTNMKLKCFLVDDPFATYDNSKAVEKILEYLKQFNSQMIITCRQLPNIDLKGINIIKL
jgi:predicted ATP-binding protein involved in virulence